MSEEQVSQTDSLMRDLLKGKLSSLVYVYIQLLAKLVSQGTSIISLDLYGCGRFFCCYEHEHLAKSKQESIGLGSPC